MSKERIPRIGTRAHPLENAVDAGERAKNALVRSKTVVEKQTGRDESSPNEYAEHEIQYAAEDSTLAARRIVVSQGRKLAHRGRETLHEPEQIEPQQPFGESPRDTPAPQTREDPMQPTYRHDEQPIPRTMEPVVPDESEKPIRQTAQRGKMSSGEPSSSNPAQKQMLIRERLKPAGAATSTPIQHNAMREQPDTLLSDTPASEGAMPLNVAVGQLNMELANTLEALQDGDYDSIDIQGESPDWREVVAVFASKTAGAHDGVDVAVLTPDRVDRLKAVFRDMCVITSEVETIDHPGEGEDEGWTEYILHITITAKTAEEMRTEYAFTSYQNEALTELLAELEPMKLLLTDLSVSQEQARALVANLPDDLAPERRAVVEAACRLVGKVSYFWGGKSLVLGWDSRWGQIQKVTAEGNSTTGTYRPYGLDCSGFVDWVFYNATDGAYYPGHGGGATMQHSYCTPISWEDALPGDLVFYPDDEHVGIVGGWDENGELLIVHCASSHNCAVITGVSGFTNAGRPDSYSD